MQVEDLLYTAKPSTQAIEKSASQSWNDVKKTAEKSVEPMDGALRSISIDQPVYQKNQLTQSTVVDQLEHASSFGDDARALKNEMVLASETMSNEDYQKMEADGFSPMNQEGQTMVTVADKIKKNLAIAGVDIDALGGLSSDEIAAMSGSAQDAAMVTDALKQADLPTDDEIIADAKTALMKASEIGPLTSESKQYLIKNELEPTIANVYVASYAKSQNYVAEAPSSELADEQWNAIQSQVDCIIEESGLEVNEESESFAKTLLSQGLAVTPANLQYMDALEHGKLATEPQQLVRAIVNSVSEGRMPQDAYMMQGYSMHDRAEIAVQQVQSMSDDQMLAQVHERRVVEEIRLMMTQDATYSMMKQGIHVDVNDLVQLVEDLRAQEGSLAQQLFPENPEGATLFEKATSMVADLREMPAVALGRIPSIPQANLTEIYNVATTTQQVFAQANERYETMATEVRRDLGDSLNKAFENIDHILEDLELEATPANERAVRILAYNQLEITKESVGIMRTNDEMVQRTLKALTPGVVKSLIDEGKNPLDMSMEKLTKVAEEAQQNLSDSNSEAGYAKFLWKMDQIGDMTPEERESYIGVYRLLHQVEATDGAVIGQLLNQGAEITLRNMMDAVRTRKHENREYVVDESFGVVTDFATKDLSITQQIEKVFLTYRAKDAKEAITPEKMQQFASEDTYMEMNPDQLATALESMDSDEQLDEAYTAQQRSILRQAVESEEQVYDLLKQYDLPLTATNLEAMSSYRKDRNRVFEMLAEIKNDIFEEFGEAVKTPEEMAEAQRKLEETAENVMRTAIIEDAQGYIDVRGMRIAMTQLKTLGTMATREETYAVPIMIADATGNMTLKIVRGKEEERGQVDVALDMDATGCIRGTFQMRATGIEAAIATDRSATRQMLSDHATELQGAIEEATGVPCQVHYTWNATMDVNDIYGPADVEFETTTEQTEIQTSKLYGLARSFINTLARISG